MQLLRSEVHLQLGIDAAPKSEPLTHGVQRHLSGDELKKAAIRSSSIVHFHLNKKNHP